MILCWHNTKYIESNLFSDLPLTGCSDREVRLVARDSLASGQVEVCEDSTWGRACSSGWDQNEASVVCRQLGFTVAGRSVAKGRLVSCEFSFFFCNSAGSQFHQVLGHPPHPILLNNLNCSGLESSLLDCPVLEPGPLKRQVPPEEPMICPSGNEAGVRCAGTRAQSAVQLLLLDDYCYYCCYIELPRIELRPPSAGQSYVIELGRELELDCLIDNTVYPRSLQLIAIRVEGNSNVTTGTPLVCDCV